MPPYGGRGVGWICRGPTGLSRYAGGCLIGGTLASPHMGGGPQADRQRPRGPSALIARLYLLGKILGGGARLAQGGRP